MLIADDVHDVLDVDAGGRHPLYRNLGGGASIWLVRIRADELCEEGF